jgi:tetratricopeptide (TPR) repeat protein
MTHKKTHYSGFIIILLSLFLIACQKSNVKKGSAPQAAASENTDLSLEYKVYAIAQSSGDYHSAIHSILRILATDPAQIKFYDTLSRLYLASGNTRSAAFYAEQSLETNPDNQGMLELAGYIYFEGGAFRKSEEKFKKLYQITKEPKYLYQLSQIYGYLDDKKKANEMLDMVLSNNNLDNYLIDLSTSTGGLQEVKIKAACWFVRANLQNTPQQALPYIKKAIQIQPNFEIARKVKEEFEIQIQREELEKVNRRLNQR